MKFPLAILLLAASAGFLTGCYTPEQKKARAAQVARDQAEWERANYEYYLEDYAHKLGKAVRELTPAERAEARSTYLRDHR